MTESAALFPRSSRAARITLLFLTVLSFVPRALAVEQTGTLKGTVHDERGQALPGAVVSVSGANLQGERATRSDVEGEFEFEALPPGLYSVKVALAGYQVIQQDRVAVHIGRITTLNVQLTPGGLMEQVTVTGSAPLVDSEHATSQDNYGPEYLEQVTLGSGRSYQDVVQNSPGTGPGDDVNPTVRGSTIGGNVYLIDGVDSTDPATQMLGQNYIYDAIEEIQLQTGGFEAEFGRASGGIVNVVTKSAATSSPGRSTRATATTASSRRGTTSTRERSTRTPRPGKRPLAAPLSRTSSGSFSRGAGSGPTSRRRGSRPSVVTEVTTTLAS